MMLHCSIYKVQYSLSRVPYQSTTLFFVCQDLFSFFSNFFRGLPFWLVSALLRRLNQYTTELFVCQELFYSFSKSFSTLFSLCLRRASRDSFVSITPLQENVNSFFLFSSDLFKTPLFSLLFKFLLSISYTSFLLTLSIPLYILTTSYFKMRHFVF